MLKTYSNKSNARRAARKQFENDDMFTLIQDAAGKWSFIEAEVEAAVQAMESKDTLDEGLATVTVDSETFSAVGVEQEEPVVGDYTHCPSCNTHLSNGVSDYWTQQQICKQHRSKVPGIEKEWICLACNEEFGETVKQVKTTSTPGPAKGLKIEKDREERNGLKRPSAGGKCAAIWAKCEEIYEASGMVPTPKTLKEWCADNGHNFNNASIELYRWRTWAGFKGRK